MRKYSDIVKIGFTISLCLVNPSPLRQVAVASKYWPQLVEGGG